MWTIFSNGLVLCPGTDAPRPLSLAVAFGRIVAIGPREDIVRGVPRGAEEVDLEGRLALPGFVDGHVHVLGLGLRCVGARVDLTGARSVHEAVATIRDHASRLPNGEWVRGGGWDANTWPEGGRPTAGDLAGVAGGRPVALSSRCGHSMWLNQEALELCGITRETPDPEGGRIERGPDGEPTGILHESALALVNDQRPTLTAELRTRALEAAISHAHSLGLVGCHNCEGAETLQPLIALERSGRLRFRVTHHVPLHHLEAAREVGVGFGLGGERLRIGSVKVFADGSLGAQTAAMLEPYHATDDRGILEETRDSLVEHGRAAAEAGMALAVHAIGDRAVRGCLDAFDELGGMAEAGLRPRIEHAQHVEESDVRRMGRMGLIASVQPVHLRSDIPLVERHLPDRTARAFAYRSMLESGAVLCFGSDAPVETMDPLEAIRAAVCRQTWDGEPEGGWRPEQRLTVAQAVTAYTEGPAWASGTESCEGRIAPGYRADFTVVSRNILAAPALLADCRVEMTVIGGEVAYRREG